MRGVIWSTMENLRLFSLCLFFNQSIIMIIVCAAVCLWSCHVDSKMCCIAASAKRSRKSAMTDDVCESYRKSTNDCAERQWKGERERKCENELLPPTFEELPTSPLNKPYPEIVLFLRHIGWIIVFRSDCAKFLFGDEMLRLISVVIQMWRKKSVNQKINTLNINNNKSSTQPNPINQFSFAFSENWFIGGKFSAVLGRNFWRKFCCNFHHVLLFE